MDGVIIDSEPSHFEAFRRTLKPLGIQLSDEEYQQYFAGKTDEQGFVDFLAYIQRPLGVKALQAIKRHHYLTLAETMVTPYSATVEAIGQLAIHRPLALVTSSPEAQVDAVFRRFKLQPFFSVRVTAEDVANGKPDPESYLLAADRLGFDAPDCVVVEDAPSGITAAKRAGMFCIALTTTHSAEQLTSADRIVDNLSTELFDEL
jgi:beta-phosphoglucomutase